MPSVLPRVDIGQYSSAGTRYGGLNQDYLGVQEVYAPGERLPAGQLQSWCLAVCDGHGIAGDKAAQDAGKSILRTLSNCALLRGAKRTSSSNYNAEIENAVRTAFMKGHASGLDLYTSPPESVVYTVDKGAGTATYALARRSTGSGYITTCYHAGPGPDKLMECGCTCTAAVLRGHTLCIGHVGDSQAVLGSRVGSSGYSLRVLTQKHNCLNAAEVERVLSHCQAADMLQAVDFHKGSSYLHIVDGPCAGTQISVTRALCHMHLEAVGVIPKPDVSIVELGPEDTCLVLGSDGVFDYMSPDEVIQHVMANLSAGHSATKCAVLLVEAAVHRQLAKSGDADNTSAIVVLLHH